MARSRSPCCASARPASVRASAASIGMPTASATVGCGERQLGGACGVGGLERHGGGGAIRVGLREGKLYDVGGGSGAFGGAARLVELAERQPAAGEELEDR